MKMRMPLCGMRILSNGVRVIGETAAEYVPSGGSLQIFANFVFIVCALLQIAQKCAKISYRYNFFVFF